MANLIRCTKATCFQNLCGTNCKILNSGYKDGNCPFYKTMEEAEKGQREAHQRLVDLGLQDLIETYEYNPQRRW